MGEWEDRYAMVESCSVCVCVCMREKDRDRERKQVFFSDSCRKGTRTFAHMMSGGNVRRMMKLVKCAVVLQA